MSYDSISQIASQGLMVEKLRLEIIAYNISHQNSTSRTKATSFVPMTVISTPYFSLNKENNLYEGGIKSLQVIQQNMPAIKTYSPSHPFADKYGFVYKANVNQVDETSNLIRAKRAYEANIKIINTAKNLTLQTLSIGKER